MKDSLIAAQKSINDVLESVVKPAFARTDQQMMRWASLFCYGHMTREDDERKCLALGFEPTGIVGFYEYGKPFPLEPVRDMVTLMRQTRVKKFRSKKPRDPVNATVPR